MHSWQCQLAFNDSSGLFAKTVSWLQNRNRLHGPLRPVDVVHRPSDGCTSQAVLRSPLSLPTITPLRQLSAFKLDFPESERHGTAYQSGRTTPNTLLNTSTPAGPLIIGNPHQQLNSSSSSQHHQQQSVHPAAHIHSHANGYAHAQHSSRLSSRALSSAIRDAASLDDLAGLYEQHPHSFRSGHIAAALARLPHAVELRLTSNPRLVDPRHERLLDQLVGRFEAFRAAGEYGARELSSGAWVLGKLGRTDRACLVAALAGDMLGAYQRHRRWQQQEQQQQEHVQVRDRNRQQQQRQQGQELGQQQEEEGQAGQEKLRAGPTPSPTSLRALHSDPKHVGMYMPATSLGVTGTPIVPVASCSGDMAARGSTAVTLFTTTTDTAVAMVAASGRGVSDEGGACPGRPPSPTTPAAAVGAARDASGDRAFPVCPLDLSNMALGLAKTGVTHPAIWRQLVAAAVPMLRDFGTQELTNLAWSLAQAHRAYYRRTAAVVSASAVSSSSSSVAAATTFSESGLASLEPADSPQIPFPHVKQRERRGRDGSSCTAEDVAVTVTVAVSSGGTGRGSRVRSDSNTLEAACHTGTQALVAAGRAQASSGLHADWQPWLGRFVESALAPRLRRTLRRCTAQQVANAAWAMAALGHADAATLAVVSEEAQTRAGGFTAQGLSQVVWAMASTVRMGRVRAAAVAANGSNLAAGGSKPGDLAADAASVWGAPLLPAGSSAEGAPLTSVPSPGPTSHELSQQQAPWQEANAAAAPPRGVSGSHRKPPPPPQPPQPAPPSSSAFAVPRPALHAIFVASVRTMRRFSPQGLSNLLYAFRTLDFPPSLGLLRRVSRVAVAAPLERLQPLGLTTLLCEWAAQGQHSMGLFALGAAAATSSMPQFAPLTLCRLLCAYGAVGHKDTALFQAAAGRLLQPMVGAGGLGHRPKGWENSDTSQSGRFGGSGGGGQRTDPVPAGGRGEQPPPPPSILLDALSSAECCQLMCAYAQVGVHVPALMDHLLARIAPSLTAYDGRCRTLPHTALRLVVALATVNHRPAAYYGNDGSNPDVNLPSESSTALVDATERGGGGAASAAASTAMTAAIRILRRSVLSLEPPQAVSGMWALVRLQAAGPAAVYRLVTQVLWRRTAPAESSPIGALGAWARSAVVAGRPWLVSRLAWLLGKGAAAAWRGDGIRAVGSGGGGAAAEDGGSVRHVGDELQGDVAAVASELSWGLVAVAEVLEERMEECDGEVLASLAEGLGAVLAVAPEAGIVRRTRQAADLYDRCAELLLTTVGEVLRRTNTTITAAAAGGQPRGRAPVRGSGDVTTGSTIRRTLAPRHLAAVVHSVYDSGVHSRTPLLWAAAARGVLAALEVACRSPATDDNLLVSGIQTRRAVSGVDLGRRQLEPEQPNGRRSNSRQPMPSPYTRPSPDDLAMLLTAAMRLDLFSYPSALPVLQKAVHCLICADSASATGRPLAGMASASASVSVTSLQALLRQCRQHASTATAPEPSLSPSSRAAAASGSSEGSGCIAPRALYAWAVRQTMGLLPWLPYTDRELVLSELRFASWEPTSLYASYQGTDLDAGPLHDGTGRSRLSRQIGTTHSRPPPPLLPLSLPIDNPESANVNGAAVTSPRAA